MNFESLTKEKRDALTQQSKHVFEMMRQNDILNIYGENPMASNQLIDTLKFTKHNKIYTRIWMSQWINNIDETQLNYLADELIIWCPGAIKEDFNEISGRDYYDLFYSKICEMKMKKTLSYTVRPMSLEDLPEFYDMVIFSGSKGIILYVSSEFSKEQLKYIKRFKKVNRIQVIEIDNKASNHCLSMPNNIGSLKYEWQDWKYAIRESINSVPFLRAILR